MKHEVLYDGGHRWVVFGRDPDKNQGIIDTNQFLVVSGERALVIEPGGTEVFAPMLVAVVEHVGIERVTDLFASHQDPDIISSLGLWDVSVPNATLHAPAIWEGFLRHFGCDHITYQPIPDNGGTIDLGNVSLHIVPAHYLHSSANFHLYDPQARILMSGDIGACLEPPGAPLFVERFSDHVPLMKYFHERWMPSEAAKQDWIARVRQLDIELMAPQHGRIFRRDDVQRFLDWFEALPVGTAIRRG